MATQSDSSMSLGKIGNVSLWEHITNVKVIDIYKDFLGIFCMMILDRLLISSDINVPDNQAILKHMIK